MSSTSEPREVSDWYSSFQSVLFLVPGNCPCTRGKFRYDDDVAQCLELTAAKHPDATLIVLSSCCGDINATSAEEWLETRAIMQEMNAERDRYIAAGVCSGCGACSPEEAETKCVPKSVADTGDFWCEGESLWPE